MKHSIIAGAAALTLALAGAAQAAPAADKATGVRLSATLGGANGGDPDGTGTFTGRLNPGQGQLCYTLTTANLDEVKMAHIHIGAAGVSGGVFVPLPGLGAGEHCVAVDQAKATALVAKPGDYYVNVHTAAFMGGAVRGQLAKN